VRALTRLAAGLGCGLVLGTPLLPGAPADASTASHDVAAADRPAPSDIIELSLDGVHWAHVIDTPLFDPALRWVPGDIRTETFYVRNTRPDAGTVEVVVERSEDQALRDSGELTLAARASDGAWTDIRSAGRHVLVDDEQLAGRDAVAVQVRAAFAFDAPNDTMVLSSDLDFDVVIRDSSVTTGGQGGPGPDGSSSLLPGTGSQIPAWALPLGLALTGAGGWLVLARRRRGSDEPEVDIVFNGARLP
jgi:LPXTG-motif cell wall-anchored protein